MADRVGFVGLGIMGRPMAENLARNFAVDGFDLDEGRLKLLERVSPVHDLGALVESCSTICLSLPSAAIVENVLIGPDGIIDRLRPHTLVIDLSTSLPSVSRRVAAALAKREIEFADAPVSGGEAGAQQATLAIMVGASENTFKRCVPILSSIGGSVVRLGEVGSGGVGKLVNNMIVASTFAVIAEGFALAEKNGVTAQNLYNAIQGGWAGSKVLNVSADAIVKREYKPGGTVDMMAKDLSYAKTLATDSQSRIPMTDTAYDIFEAGQAAGRGKESQPAIIELWQKEK